MAEVELGGTIVRWPPSVTYLNSAANENFLFKNAFSPYDSVQPHFFLFSCRALLVSVRNLSRKKKIHLKKNGIKILSNFRSVY